MVPPTVRIVNPADLGQSLTDSIKKCAAVDNTRSAQTEPDDAAANPMVSAASVENHHVSQENTKCEDVEIHQTESARREKSGNSTPLSFQLAVKALSMSMEVLPADPNQVFVARRYTTILVGDLAILLTFGSIYPPLAVVVCLSVLINSVSVQLVMGRFVSLAQSFSKSMQTGVSLPMPIMGASEQEQRLWSYVEVIKRETAAVGSLIALSLAPITILAAVFWSFFLFDIYGDEMGTKRSLWILFVLPLCLLAIRLIGWLLNIKKYQTLLDEVYERWFATNHQRDLEERSMKTGIEMRESSVIITRNALL
jgi:hypothetical protein